MSRQLDELLARFADMTGRWRADTPLAAMRVAFDDFYQDYPTARGMTLTPTNEPVPGEWVATPEVETDRVVLLLHGGGFCMGSARAHRAYASHLSRACGASVLTIDYRLAPEHTCPAALEDALAAYQGLLQGGFSPANIALCGDSAGGGLALALLVRLREAKILTPACAALVSPWADLSCSGWSYAAEATDDPVTTREMALTMAQTYLGANGNPRDPSNSPVYADLANLPPVLIVMGEREIFVDDGRTIARRIQAGGGEVVLQIWPGMIHQFPIHVGILDESALALGGIGSFIREKSAPGQR